MKITEDEANISSTAGRRAVEQSLRDIAHEISAATGETFFRSLVQFLTRALKADYALIGELIDDSSERIRTIAVCADGEIVENIDYKLAGTPCEEVVNRDLCYFKDSVQQQFASDAQLSEMRIESYIGTPLRDSGGRVMGLLSVMSRRPLEDEQMAEATLRIFAARASAELERRRFEEALCASEEKYRVLVENLNDVVYAVDERGRITYISPIIETLSGYTPAEVMGHCFTEFIHPEDLPTLLKHVQQTIEGRIEPLEYRVISKSGDIRWVRSSSRPVRLENGAVWLQGIITDITARKRAESIQAAIYRISEAAFTSENLQTLYRLIHEIIGELMPASNFYIALYDSDAETISFPYFVDEREEPPVPRRLRQGLTEYVLRTGAPLHGLPEVLERLEAAGEAELIGANAVDWLGVPLKTKEKTIGALVIQSYTEGVTFGEEEKSILEFVSTQVAMAIERKRAEQERARLLTLEQAARMEAEHMGWLRKELLDREKAARREWQATFDAMTDAVMIADRSDRLIRANRAFYERVGLAPDECVGRPVSELVHRGTDKFPSANECPICQLRLKGERGAKEFPAGVVSNYPIFVSVDPITDDHGNVAAVVEVVRDLTELHRAREEAERERVSLNATIEQMAEGFMVFDQAGRVIRANRHAQQIFGYTLEQMATDSNGTLAEGRFHYDEGQAVPVEKLPVQTAISERRIVETSLFFTRPDGSRVMLSITASPFFSNDGQLAGAIVLVRDITELKREREQLQQAEKLRALGQLASGVAHNFNNALAAVIGYTQLALPKVKNSDVEEYLRVVEQAAKDAARMVERIQNFSRRRPRKDDFLQVRLADIVCDAIDITRPRWRTDAQVLGIKYDVEFSWEAEEDLTVNGEASELREVFVNIIMNALDAMPTGGRLLITGKSVGRSLQVSFADTGSGMTEEVRRRIFEPFFTTKGVSGLGMGLSESYRIIERHGGRIDVESQLRRGTIFTIMLPLASPVKAETQTKAVEPTVKGARVLIIDDEKFVRDVLSAMLADQGHTVMKAASAEEGMKLAELYKFDLVFSDLAMPKDDGIAAAKGIKERQPEAKVILMSGYGSDKVYERADDTDSIDIAISKPFRLEEIQRAMKTLLE